MAKEKMPKEKHELIMDFMQKIDNYGEDKRRKEWYELISKRPEIISTEFLDMVDPLSTEHINVVKLGLEAGLDLETVKVYAEPYLASQVYRIFEGILSGIELDKIKLYAKEEFLGYICDLNEIAKQLDFTTMQKYCSLNIPAKYIVGALEILAKHGIEERAKILCANCFNDSQRDKLLEYAKNEEITLEQLRVIANPKFDKEQMEQVMLGYECGLKRKQVVFYAKPTIPSFCMCYIRDGFLRGWDWEKIKLCSSIGKKYTERIMAEVYKCFVQRLSLEDVEIILDVSLEPNGFFANLWEGDENIDMARSILKYHKCTTKDLQEISKVSKHRKKVTLEIVLEGLKNNISIENIKYYVTKESNIDEIILGFKNGLTLEQVKLFAEQKLSEDLIRTIRMCLEQGMSIDEAKVMIATYQWEEMWQFIESKKPDLYGLIAGLLKR